MPRALIFLCPLLLVACTALDPGPRNLSDLKNELAEYSTSGDYQGDLAKSVSSAESYLRKRKAKGGQNLAVIFDIDETVLSNLPHMKEMDWGYQPTQWNAWVETAQGPALDPVRDIYHTAIELELHIFFLTGRTEDDRAATVRNLRAQGMGSFEQLLLRPKRGTAPYEKAVDYKSRTRKNLTANGYTIIASFGDQESDLEGGYSERAFKLPNPFYRIP